MKPFISYIFETTEHKPLGSDFFIHTSGKLIEPRKMPLQSQFIDHVYIPMTQPEDFGMTEHQMDHLLGFSDLEKLHVHKTGQGPYESRIFHELSDRGFLKGIHKKHRDEPKHTIRLEAAKSSVLGRHGIESMIEPIRTLRSKITPGHDVSLHIEGLKFHEPDDLRELHDRLSPEHIKQLTDESRIHFKNIEEVDRFLGTSTKRSRDPGTGLEPTPSPEEMRRKAGKTDEPESIQRGRFFQSDSYNPMKSFKYIISEGDYSKQNNIHESIFSAIPYKSWMTHTGEVIKVPDDSRVHHIHMVVDDPKKFNTSTAVLKRLDPENYERLVQRKENWSTPIITNLGKKGFMRVVNNTAVSKDIVEPFNILVRHRYQLTNHGNHDPAVFVEPLKRIRENIANNMQPHDDLIHVLLEGTKLGKTRYETTTETHSLKSLSDIDNFIKNHGTGRERAGTLPDIPHMPTSTQLRGILGRTPPEGSRLTQAQWNLMRTIGDSYNPMKSFKDYIAEGGIEPVKPVVPIQPDPRRKRPPEKPPVKPTEKPPVKLPIRQPDEFIPSPTKRDFRPYRRNAK
jgi:hypothetical protein